MIGPDVVTIARRWVGTPYRHQASLQGVGADCLGLVRGVWRELYGAEPELPPPYSRDWAEAGRDEVLWRAAARHMAEHPVAEARPGDVLLFRMSEVGVAKHLGILARPGPDATFVHAYARHGVLESPLSDPWARRVVACFSFPEGGR